MQFSLRATLIIVVVMGGLFWTYAQAWGVISGPSGWVAAVASFLYPIMACAAVGIAIQRMRHGFELVGGMACGAVGGALGTALHLLCFDMLNPAGIEHEGLALVRGGPMTAVGAIIGLMGGTVTWAVWRVIAFLRMIDAEHREMDPLLAHRVCNHATTRNPRKT